VQAGSETAEGGAAGIEGSVAREGRRVQAEPAAFAGRRWTKLYRAAFRRPKRVCEQVPGFAVMTSGFRAAALISLLQVETPDQFLRQQRSKLFGDASIVGAFPQAS
jgi:hypothetical protein